MKLCQSSIDKFNKRLVETEDGHILCKLGDQTLNVMAMKVELPDGTTTWRTIAVPTIYRMVHDPDGIQTYAVCCEGSCCNPEHRHPNRAVSMRARGTLAPEKPKGTTRRVGTTYYKEDFREHDIERFRSGLVEIENDCLIYGDPKKPSTVASMVVDNKWTPMQTKKIMLTLEQGASDKVMYNKCGTKGCCNLDHYDIR